MKRLTTEHISMNPHSCIACWKCVEKCPKKVIGKVGFPWHKHAILKNADACIGCKMCIKACPQGVFSELDKENSNVQKTRYPLSIIERIMPIAVIATAITGFGLHVARHSLSHEIWHSWAVVHVMSSCVWLLALVPHIKRHIGWYKAMISCGSFKKAWLTILLSIALILTAATGIMLIAFIDGANSIMGLRHYWLGILLTILTIAHIVKHK